MRILPTPRITTPTAMSGFLFRNFSAIWNTITVLKITILTLFPEAIEPYLKASILGRAEEKKLLKFSCVNFRAYATGKHRTVDEKAYGGGPGMVLKPEPIEKTVKKALKKGEKSRVILFSTRGKLFSQKDARRLAKYKHLVLICGRYEGVDERIASHVADEEISIGDFVLSGGEIPALAVADAVSRQIPGVLGKAESLEERKGSYPVYTRPEKFIWSDGGKRRSAHVPADLLSGDHKKIREWRKNFWAKG